MPKAGGRFGGLDSLKDDWMEATYYRVFNFGFMYLLVLGYFTTRLEDDSGWATSESARIHSNGDCDI